MPTLNMLQPHAIPFTFDRFPQLQDFDLDEEFGAVVADTDLEGTIELVGRMNGPYATHEFALRVSLVMQLCD